MVSPSCSHDIGKKQKTGTHSSQCCSVAPPVARIFAGHREMICLAIWMQEMRHARKTRTSDASASCKPVADTDKYYHSFELTSVTTWWTSNIHSAIYSIFNPSGEMPGSSAAGCLTSFISHLLTFVRLPFGAEQVMYHVLIRAAFFF